MPSLGVALAVVLVLLGCATCRPGVARAATRGGGAPLRTPANHAKKTKHTKHTTRTEHAKATKHRRTKAKRRARRHASSPLAGRAMWIWELPYSNGGDLSSIIAQAHRYGVGTLMIKSSDGTGAWSQFSAALVHDLHAAHLRVCAWQYVYGNRPGVEANVGAAAVHDGADCLIVDAESEYEGKYVAAQAYVRDLRKQIGGGYPLVLAGFPYVDYHPAFPYSVFLGPGGAQYNVPQMYWRDIETTVDAVFAHTYAYNLIYGRPIYPLGQVYANPPSRQIVRFRELSRVYGAAGVSWWDWQEAGAREWTAVSRPAGTLPGYAPYEVMAPIALGARGDLVVWAQEHLVSAGYQLAVDGDFGANMHAAVQAFQAEHELFVDGVIGNDTWHALLRYPTAAVHWVHRDGRPVALFRAAAARRPTSGRAAGRTLVEPVPLSASRRARRDEIPPSLGAGRPAPSASR